ncbi:hypothetical protein [Aquabacterium sp. NJ1]|uniref:hypothetical protein n=1 Tax=Aquabacterium sp. NJ1 TaxID=1538295 RepID=UPI001269A2E4|nr:hypothetical protein [Aquabacterium sp. NJ1]
MPTSEVLLDDGVFFIELNPNYPSRDAPGFLQRRCPVTQVTPSGWDCVGSFERDSRGKWRADVNAPYDEENDSDVLILGEGLDRMTAIAMLWRRRHEAYVKQR